MHLNVYWITAILFLAMAVTGMVVLIRRLMARREIEKWQEEFGASADEAEVSESEEQVADSEPIVWGRMEVMVDDRRISTHRIHLEETTVGRDPGKARIVIPELIVSKRHCALFERDGKLWIRDEASTNGMYRNGEKVSESQVDHGAVFFLGRRGNVKLVFLTDSPIEE